MFGLRLFDLGAPALLEATKEASEETTRLFGLDAQLLFDAALLLVTMLVLYILLSYLLFNPTRQILEKRKERIAGEKKQAEDDKAAAAKLKEEYEAKLKNIDKEAEEILSDAKKRAAKNESRIIEEAKAEAERIIEHAKNEIVLEQKKAADDIKQQIIDVATLMAGKVAVASIDEKKQAALIDEALKEIGEETWLS